MRKGLYIVFEGVVACGKTTQSKLLKTELQKIFSLKQVIWTREPGGSEISDAIRKTVQATPFSEEMDPICEAYLYAASRAQTLRNIIFPVLEQDGVVIADRSFVTSLAFQGSARGVGVDTILRINEIAIEGFIPDLVVYINLDPEIALQRVQDRDGDKFESFGIEFFKKVANGYTQISQMKMFENRWLTIDGSGTIKEVQQLIQQGVEPYLSF